MEAKAEKTALVEQRVQKKAARRAAFIQDVAEAVWALQPTSTISLTTVKAAGNAAIARADAEAASVIKSHPLLQGN